MFSFLSYRQRMPPKFIERHVGTPSQRWDEMVAQLGEIAAQLEAIETSLGELKELVHVLAILRV
jgi:hypothetical protein